MLRCSKEAFAACPDRHGCGCPDEATFTEGSDCDKFNRQFANHTLTNADRIRAMSDEELAKEFGHTSLCGYIQRECDPFCENRAVCANCIVDWLQQPVKGE